MVKSKGKGGKNRHVKKGAFASQKDHLSLKIMNKIMQLS